MAIELLSCLPPAKARLHQEIGGMCKIDEIVRSQGYGIVKLPAKIERMIYKTPA
jgi:hypothetical protein